jgi:large subunit ribosomal protein L14
MLSVGSRLTVIDNSGALDVECIRILGGKTIAFPGAILIVAVKKINPKKRIQKGEVHRAVLVATRKLVSRSNGFQVGFSVNSAVIVNNKNVPLGTRLLAPVMLDIRYHGMVKILSMATLSI